MRWVCVKVPAFSTCVAAGKRKTSVPISSVFNSPVLISGESYQNDAVSISWKSRTTNHFSDASPRRCIPPLDRSEEHTSELQSRFDLVCRLLLEKKNTKYN